LIREYIRKLRTYLNLTRGGEISRRYFIINSFDGIVTILGILIAAYTIGNMKPTIILSVSFGSIVGMGISGFFGAFIAEKVEREIEMSNLKHAMLVNDFKGTILEKAIKATVIWSATVDCLSTILSGLLILVPEILALYGFIGNLSALYLSISLSLALLFALGSYMYKLTGKNVFKGGIVFLVTGLLTMFIITILLRLF